MSRASKLAKLAMDDVLRWRWRIVAVIMGVFLTAEAIEHRIDGQWGSSFWEILVFGVALPLLGGLLLSLYDTQSKLSSIISQLNWQRAFKQQLAQAQDWDELVTILLQIPRTLVPVIGDSLMVFEQETGSFQLVDQWGLDGIALPSKNAPIESAYCINDLLHGSQPRHNLYPCYCQNFRPANLDLNHFCLPLVQREIPIALMHLFLPKDITLNGNQISALTEISPDMALAIERFQLWRLVVDQSSASSEDRQNLARHLHDTIAPDLAYLRLKLDQLFSEETLKDNLAVRNEIERMRSVANQSYNHVRASLSELQGAHPTDLIAQLKVVADNFSERAGFKVEFVHDGQPRRLPAETGRQILYIVREVLRNIEKHANAHHVTITIVWGNDHLTIVTADDGMGFDPQTIAERDNSYGLRMIRECAAELNGRITFTSLPNEGTQINLWLPLSDKVEANQ